MLFLIERIATRYNGTLLSGKCPVMTPVHLFLYRQQSAPAISSRWAPSSSSNAPRISPTIQSISTTASANVARSVAAFFALAHWHASCSGWLSSLVAHPNWCTCENAMYKKKGVVVFSWRRMNSVARCCALRSCPTHRCVPVVVQSDHLWYNVVNIESVAYRKHMYDCRVIHRTYDTESRSIHQSHAILARILSWHCWPRCHFPTIDVAYVAEWF